MDNPTLGLKKVKEIYQIMMSERNFTLKVLRGSHSLQKNQSISEQSSSGTFFKTPLNVGSFFSKV
ncbi:MAG: hypothetical protein CMP11_05790 [Zetaproteobacteria bacterium]|nr:hypothetical protein [Pseudobdellovibrionaceae bacterium]